MKDDKFWKSMEGNYDMDFLDTSANDVTEDQILDYLARIVSDIYLAEHFKQREKGENSTLQEADE
jgi:hypothetical protein